MIENMWAGMSTVDLLTVNHNSQLSQTQTLWLPLHFNKVAVRIQ